MKVGITATRAGLTPLQIQLLAAKLVELSATELHHGDCLGGDAAAHEVGRKLGLRIIGHLPNNPSQRAFCKFDETRTPKPYLERNHCIVDECDWLIGLPETSDEILRSGTWATIRYARKAGKPRTILAGDINAPSQES